MSPDSLFSYAQTTVISVLINSCYYYSNSSKNRNEDRIDKYTGKKLKRGGLSLLLQAGLTSGGNDCRGGRRELGDWGSGGIQDDAYAPVGAAEPDLTGI
jgi:hypothetical protein